MGGKVGLKGTDGLQILTRARELKAVPEAEVKALRAIKLFLPAVAGHEFYVPAGEMGADSLARAGIPFKVTWFPPKITTGSDTCSFLEETIKESKIDLVVFVGGDGTAKDVYSVIAEKIPVIGIPAGVKIHSGCFAVTPERGGDLVASFLQGKIRQIKTAEVVDLDEDLYRFGEIQGKLSGYLKIPCDARLQNRKSGSGKSETSQQEQIAFEIIDQMKKDHFYLIGPGTTTRALWQKLDLNGSLLGVDLIYNQQLVARDLSEEDVLTLLNGKQAGLVITPTGGQGFLLGRGNHQISPRVMQFIEKKDIIVAATPEKIISLNGQPLYIDTGCLDTNLKLAGYYKIVTGFRRAMMYRAIS